MLNAEHGRNGSQNAECRGMAQGYSVSNTQSIGPMVAIVMSLAGEAAQKKQAPIDACRIRCVPDRRDYI